MSCAVLIVDRDETLTRQLIESLRPFLVQVHAANQREDALRLVSRRRLDAVVIDEKVLSVSEYIAKRSIRSTPFLVTTDRRDYSMLLASLRARASDVLERPIDPKRLAQAVAGVLGDRVASPHYLSRKIDAYVRENCDKSLSLELVAERFGISRNYVSSLLRQGGWRGFTSRLAHHRIKRAKRLMVATDSPLYEIAEKSGFATPSRLSETFVRLTGQTPKKYRQVVGARGESSAPSAGHG